MRKEDRIVVGVLVGCVALIGLSVLSVYWFLTRGVNALYPPVTPFRPSTLRQPIGIDIAVPLSSANDHVVVARLTLPEVRANRGWYANWVMIVDRAHQTRNVQTD